MKIFILDADHNITVYASQQEAASNIAGCVASNDRGFGEVLSISAVACGQARW